MDKAELRSVMRRLSAEFPQERRIEEDASLWPEVEARPEFASAGTVLFYMSLPDEVCTRDAVSRWHRAGKRIVLPQVISENRMLLREYVPGKLVRGAFGIDEPGSECPVVALGDIGLAVVPGVAFDASGRRLGRGRGYYDRLLSRLDCPKIGVCHSFRLVDYVPFGACDEKVDIVICGKEARPD